MTHYIMKAKMHQNGTWLNKELQLFSVSQNVKIAALLLPGDIDFINACAVSLAEYITKNLKGYDVVLTAEFKGAFLAHALSEQLFNRGYFAHKRFVIARKCKKVYMGSTTSVSVKTITTGKRERLHISEADVGYLKGKKVLLVDDVISTGGAMAALTGLAQKCKAICCHKVCVAVEGLKSTPHDVVALANIPLFDSNGNEIWKD